MIAIATMSSTIAIVSRNSRSAGRDAVAEQREHADRERDVGRRRDRPARARRRRPPTIATKMSDRQRDAAGARRSPGSAAARGRAARRTTSSRLISSPTTKKNSAISPSLTQCCRSSVEAEVELGAAHSVRVGVAERGCSPRPARRRRRPAGRRRPRPPRGGTRRAGATARRTRVLTPRSTKRSASARKKSRRVMTPSTRPSSTTGTTSTRWCRKISATWVSEKSGPTSTCSVFMYCADRLRPAAVALLERVVERARDERRRA